MFAGDLNWKWCFMTCRMIKLGKSFNGTISVALKNCYNKFTRVPNVLTHYSFPSASYCCSDKCIFCGGESAKDSETCGRPFFQAFLLVPTPDKVANLRENLKEALSKKRTQEDVSLSGYSDSPLFDEAISMGFKRHAYCNNMGISESNPPRETSALRYYFDNILNHVNGNYDSKKYFQRFKFIMEDSLFANYVLYSMDKPEKDLALIAVASISTSYRHAKNPIDASPVHFALTICSSYA